MYHYLTDKQFLSVLYSTCSNIINELVQYINSDKILLVKANLVGSGVRKLITQNENEAIDLDFNLVVINSYTFELTDGASVKEYIKRSFNKILNKYGWGDCSDSTSVLTTSQRYFTNIDNNTLWSIDLGIIHENPDGSWYRLIHKKTGCYETDEWYWVPGKDSKGLRERVKQIKYNNLWQEVRETYLNKKNMYLRRNDYEHPSFICYIEAVNEVYNKNFK